MRLEASTLPATVVVGTFSILCMSAPHADAEPFVG